MKVLAEIFSQGEEVVCGQILDSNAAWLAQHLNELGFTVRRHTAVGDRLDDLVGLIKEIAGRADCCICTGGLGPTCDDLTAEAVSIAAGQALQLDEVALRQIEAYFSQRQRPMPDINRKQAYFPQQATRIDNPTGTAPGFAMRIQRCWFVFLPGVPSEMKVMFSDVREQLLSRFSLQPDRLMILRSIGIGESAIQQCLAKMMLPDDVQLGFRAARDEVQTKLLFPGGFSQSELERCVQQAAGLIGDYVFAIDGLEDERGGDLLTVIERGMSLKNRRLAVLETASGGLLAAKCQGRDWLETVLIAKDIAGATRQLAAEPDSGEDLSKTAERLASRLMQLQGVDFALVQLFQGSRDDYQQKDKPITLYNCLKTGAGFFHRQQTVSGAAQTKQNQAALLSLDLLRRTLQNQCL
ncbi:competence/damage-inducible protein A [Methylomonas methanica]|uniref:Molybdopterin binding domain protein n=1 Tax=Methylomonas methanica (strain DSM 25384 / MC09) TaxID=857087 RepID=G0A5Y5_METMM|nr:molybdopterin-binding protein [Methylomonas methanica]AEF99262.1 molybdopterin binding domain protein [Methylomonas methanica MC09]